MRFQTLWKGTIALLTWEAESQNEVWDGESCIYIFEESLLNIPMRQKMLDTCPILRGWIDAPDFDEDIPFASMPSSIKFQTLPRCKLIPIVQGQIFAIISTMDQIVKIFGRNQEGKWLIYDLDAEDTAKASRKGNLRGADMHVVMKPNIDPLEEINVAFEQEVLSIKVPPSLVLFDGKGQLQIYFIFRKPLEGKPQFQLIESQKINISHQLIPVEITDQDMHAIRGKDEDIAGEDEFDRNEAQQREELNEPLNQIDKEGKKAEIKQEERKAELKDVFEIEQEKKEQIKEEQNQDQIQKQPKKAFGSLFNKPINSGNIFGKPKVNNDKQLLEKREANQKQELEIKAINNQQGKIVDIKIKEEGQRKQEIKKQSIFSKPFKGSSLFAQQDGQDKKANTISSENNIEKSKSNSFFKGGSFFKSKSKDDSDQKLESLQKKNPFIKQPQKPLFGKTVSQKNEENKNITEISANQGKSLFAPINPAQRSPEMRSSEDITMSKIMDSTLSLSEAPSQPNSSQANTPVVGGGSPISKPFQNISVSKSKLDGQFMKAQREEEHKIKFIPVEQEEEIKEDISQEDISFREEDSFKMAGDINRIQHQMPRRFLQEGDEHSNSPIDNSTFQSLSPDSYYSPDLKGYRIPVAPPFPSKLLDHDQSVDKAQQAKRMQEKALLEKFQKRVGKMMEQIKGRLEQNSQMLRKIKNH